MLMPFERMNMNPEISNGSTRWLQCAEQFQDIINSIRVIKLRLTQSWPSMITSFHFTKNGGVCNS